MAGVLLNSCCGKHGNMVLVFLEMLERAASADEGQTASEAEDLQETGITACTQAIYK